MELSRCPFCAIAETYPATEAHVPENPDPERISPTCHLILSTENVLAFLDIMPITFGHVLIIPRNHKEKLSELKVSESAAMGMWLPAVSRAVMKAIGKEGGDWNVVQNNGASAAQVVPHVHYHIIPRGGGQVQDVRVRSWQMFGKGQRDELMDEDGVKISAEIRKALRTELQEMSKKDTEGLKLLGKL